jgi:hypothetical protein
MRAVAAVAALALSLFVGEWQSAQAANARKAKRPKGFGRGGLASPAQSASSDRPW